MDNTLDQIRHEFTEENGRRYHRLVLGPMHGKWVRADEFARLGDLFASPEQLVFLPEVFRVKEEWAIKIEPKQILEEPKNWKPI